jgi:hypothetical protein
MSPDRLGQASEREPSLAGEEQPDNEDDAELGDGQKERSKRSKGHSELIVGPASVAVAPRKGDS